MIESECLWKAGAVVNGLCHRFTDSNEFGSWVGICGKTGVIVLRAGSCLLRDW